MKFYWHTIIYHLAKQSVKKSFYLDLNYLKYIPFSGFFLNNIDIFLSSYLTYIFPPRSKNIYLSHDIYDSPMTEKRKEKKLFNKINELDYIFASSSISKKYFLNKLKKYNKIIKPDVKNTGYLKLDNIYNIMRKKSQYQKNVVLITPGFSNYFKDINLKNHLEDIIKEFIFKLKMKVIYRPHPLDLNFKGDYKFVKKIQNIFYKNSRFKLDNSISYLNSFKLANFMVTDITSTAYTFSYSTNKPVIFFSPNEVKIIRDNSLKTNYFNDRKKIGIVVMNINGLKKTINFIDKNRVNLKKKIIITRNSRIEYFNNSKQKMFLEINKIANNV